MDIDAGSDSDQALNVEHMSIDQVIPTPEATQNIPSDGQMVVARNSGISMVNEEDCSVEAPTSNNDIVPYERGVVRRRVDRSPEISDGEGPGTTVVKRTRPSGGNEVVVGGTNSNERTWRPVERGMVLQANVTHPDALEADQPHEVSQPRHECPS
ncbi:hypothetical protein V1525DRAFT_438362 [Lipomyces kononenkoae]|uniref:Uncharacterized protein n=1 Tax=Lipomyces kononenkoae TaxID=34357 RepID=A0ACC3SS74_LIPKO